MPTKFDNEEYLETEEAMTELDVSRQHFYTMVRPQLRVYHFATKKKPWFKRADVLALKTNALARSRPPIVISGLLEDWTTYARSFGLQVDTESTTIEIVSLDAEQLPPSFNIADNQQFVKRARISFVNQVPICLWSTYYPLSLVQGELLEEMKRNPEMDVVRKLAEQHGIIVAQAKDRYSARAATIEEQEVLQLLRDDPVLILQRVSYTHTQQLVLYSYMTLLGSWFAPEHSYQVTHWQNPTPERARDGLSKSGRVKSPAKKQAVSRASQSVVEALPPGLTSWHGFATLHHIPKGTVQKAVESERLKIVQGVWKVKRPQGGATQVKGVLNAEGRRQFYALFHGNRHFKPCPDCPHSS